MDKTTQRLFFALEIEARSKQKIVRLMDILKSVQREDVPLRWTPKDNLHITLRFMGETPLEKQCLYVAAVQEALRNTPPFYIKTTQLMGLPSSRYPRLVALGVKKTSELTELFERVNDILVALGFPKEKHTFMPHITLVKAKHYSEAMADLLKMPHKCEVISQKVEHLILFRTDDQVPAGSIYTPLEGIGFFDGVF
jgi:2'-5' RNA ligase